MTRNTSDNFGASSLECFRDEASTDASRMSSESYKVKKLSAECESVQIFNEAKVIQTNATNMFTEDEDKDDILQYSFFWLQTTAQIPIAQKSRKCYPRPLR